MGGIGESKEMRKFTVASIILFTTILSGSVGADVFIDGHPIPGSDILSIAVSPTNGDITINTKDGYTVQKGVVQPPPPGSVQITSFTATPNNLIAGGTVSISWSTTNAVSCTPTNGNLIWPNVAITLPNGSVNLNLPNASTFNFTLECLGSGGASTDTETVAVVVNPVGTPPPDPTGCPATPLSGTVSEWKNFWAEDFPWPEYSNRTFDVPRFGYRSLRFQTGNFVDNGSFTAKDTTQTAGVRLGTITECPGDFSASVPLSCRKTWGLGGSLRWATDGTTGACQLEPNTTYYFNLTYTDGVNSNVSSCGFSPCRSNLQHNNLQ